MNLDALIADLKYDEGLRLKPYRDSVGILTIGYGRNLEANGISQAEAEYLLTSDALTAVRDAASLVPNWYSLDDVRAGVIANMAFNMGKDGLAGFKRFLAAVNEGRFSDAASEMVDSKWYAQVGARARRLEQQMRTGQRDG